jgi:hypothetical protein
MHPLQQPLAAPRPCCGTRHTTSAATATATGCCSAAVTQHIKQQGLIILSS